MAHYFALFSRIEEYLCEMRNFIGIIYLILIHVYVFNKQLEK